MPISPGAPRTLPVGFLAPCSRLPGCAGCTSSPTCSVWWCTSDGQALDEVHCMSSLEHMHCQGRCLDVPIHSAYQHLSPHLIYTVCICTVIQCTAFFPVFQPPSPHLPNVYDATDRTSGVLMQLHCIPYHPKALMWNCI